MAGKKFTEKHRITYYEGDQTGKATIPMLMNIMILASEDQSEALNVGSDVVDPTGLGWVVTQYVINVKRLPSIDEIVEVGTEAVNHNDYFCQRDFWISDENGEEIVRVTSIFVLMNRTTRKMSKLLPEVIGPYESEPVKRIVRLPKVAATDSEPIFDQKYAVRYFDIDANHHVNNARYFEWMLNTVDDQWLTEEFPVMINIRYHREVQPEQIVQSIVRSIDGDNDSKRTLHQILVNDEVYCEAEIEWQPRLV
ncbi:acyl-ACP thioesterase domain-containing protein [Pediococcus argentinicus]|uniref:acyl-[acyl-carrier-protein] thioesterase n=1 Tax=Pediococcus argentinicus TaxID=480391 RepID=UPI0033905C55